MGRPLPSSRDRPQVTEPALERSEAGRASAPSDGSTASSALTIGSRAIANTFFRSGGELVGRLASLVLFAVTARHVGQDGLGAFVFAIAYLGFVMVVVDLGLDRFMLLAIARDRPAGDRLFFNFLSLKVAVAVPLLGASFLALPLLGYSYVFQATTWALAPGVFFDSVARLQLAVFMGHERGGPPSFADMIQRILSAALGIAALEAGYGVIAVAIAYSVGSAIGVLIGFVLLARTVGMPARAVEPRRWRGLAVESLPFASQDVFTVMLARLDTLILSLLAAEAVVGRYGAAYRLFESSFLLVYALGGSFSAMYAYLGHDTTPSLRFMFQRSIKLAIVLLTPVAVLVGVLAEPICRLIYGAAFASAAAPLRILAPAIVLLGVVSLATSLMLSRDNPRRMVSLTAAIVFVNVALNLILIPLYSDTGAAVAMLASEALFAAWTMRWAYRAVRGVEWLPMLAGTLAAGACMVLTTLLLHGSPVLAAVGGLLVYALALFAVERLVSPRDVELLGRMLRTRLTRVRQPDAS